MSGWKWEAEIGSNSAGPAYVTCVGGLGVFDTEAEAEAAARSLLGKTVGDYRKHAKADPYIEAGDTPDSATVTGATLQRFNDDGIYYDSQRDLP